MNIKRLTKDGIEALLRHMPAKVRVMMKEVPVIERLDYPGVQLDIQSWLEYTIRRDSCRREPGTVAWVEKMKPGDMLYDVGANVGVYSLIAAKQGNQVHAFEPMGVNFATLLKNLLLNKAITVQPWMIALSDETGIGPFHVAIPNDRQQTHEFMSGAGLSALGAPIDYKNRAFVPMMTYQVLSYRLDDFVEQFRLPRPTHIKIDVDGIEFKVLQGAKGLLHTVKSIMVELENDDAETKAIHDFLGAYGLTTNVQHRDYENVSNWEFSR